LPALSSLDVAAVIVVVVVEYPIDLWSYRAIELESYRGYEAIASAIKPHDKQILYFVYYTGNKTFINF